MLSASQQLKLLDILKEENFLSAEKYAKLKEMLNSGVDLLDELQKDKSIKNEIVAQAVAKLLGLAYQPLKNVKVELKYLKIVPEDLAKNYRLAVFDKQGDTLKVAMFDPTDLKAQEAMDYIAREKGLKVKYFVTSPESLEDILDQYSGLKTEVSAALNVAKGKMEEKKSRQVKKEEKEKLTEVVKSAPVAKMVSVILKHAVDGGASDVHIEPYSDSSRVRFRVDGILHTSLILPKYIHSALVSRIKVLANLKIDETRIPQDGRIRLNILGKNVDFRVSTLPLYEQEKVVIRILDTSSGTLTLDKLGFEGHNLAVMQENIKKPHGMFLVTGPTGSGKSTTLYSVLNILNQEGVNIVTLEDPVEYYLTGVNQSQVRPEVGLTFATGLRSILRQDPDIIMVGEIRDNETAELAIHASLTGHIVLSTLHTNDAFGALPRLLDMKVEPFLISSTLNLVVAQRLVRKICEDCKQEVKIPEKMKQQIIDEIKKIPKSSLPKELAGIDMKNLKFYKGKGCPMCNYTGYKGRLAIVEVLAMTDNLKDLIVSNKLGSEVKKEAVAQGMISMQQDGILKVLRGMTTMEEVLRATRE